MKASFSRVEKLTLSSYLRGLLAMSAACYIYVVFTVCLHRVSATEAVFTQFTDHMTHRHVTVRQLKGQYACILAVLSSVFFIFHLVSLQFSVFVPIYHVFQSFYIFNNV